MGLKYSTDFTVAFSKSLYFYSHKKCHSLPRVSKKVDITTKFQKTELDKYAASGVAVFSITSTAWNTLIMIDRLHLIL